MSDKPQKAFGLHDSRDILKKLTWEMNNMCECARHDIESRQYHAFNCAVTAWHLTDWLWHDMQGMSEESKYLVQKTIGKKSLKSIECFQSYVRTACYALCLSYEIANGSKHCRLRRPNPGISTSISDGEGYDYGNPIIVEDDADGTRHRWAYEVFLEAKCWVETFVREHHIFPEEPFVPFGDGPSENYDRLRQVRVVTGLPLAGCPHKTWEDGQ